jgi:hypothetical protein
MLLPGSVRHVSQSHRCCCRLPRGFDSDWEGGEQMSAMVSMRGLFPRDLMPVGGVAVTRDTVNHWLLDSMCCDGYHVPRSYNCLQPLCVPAAFPRRLLPGAIYCPLRKPTNSTEFSIYSLPTTCRRQLSITRLTSLLQRARQGRLLAASHAPAAAAPLRRG